MLGKISSYLILKHLSAQERSDKLLKPENNGKHVAQNDFKILK